MTDTYRCAFCGWFGYLTETPKACIDEHLQIVPLQWVRT